LFYTTKRVMQKRALGDQFTLQGRKGGVRKRKPPKKKKKNHPKKKRKKKTKKKKKKEKWPRLRSAKERGSWSRGEAGLLFVRQLTCREREKEL